MNKNKNILFISHMDVYPCKHGGDIGVFYPLNYFAQKCNAYFAFPTINDIDESISKFKKFNIKAIPYKLDTKDNYWRYPFSLFSKLSFKFSKFYRKDFMEKLCLIIKENNIDTVWCFAAQTSNYGIELKKRFPNLKIYLREHNIEYKLVKQYAQGSSNLFMKLIAYFEYLKTKVYEINAWKNFNKVFFISDTDIEIAQKYNKTFNKTNLIYDGMEEKNINNNIAEEECSFIFSGPLTSYQNKRNLSYFIKNIWTKFIKKVPEAKLYLTGNKDEYLSKRLGLSKVELEKLNIINLGFVDNLDNIISSKKYFISPTLYGSGIRIKVLEGLALKKVIFLTDIDYRMVSLFKDMENVVHYNDAEDFYNKFMLLENNQLLYNNIKEHGYSLLHHFSWENYVMQALKEME